MSTKTALCRCLRRRCRHRLTENDVVNIVVTHSDEFDRFAAS